MLIQEENGSGFSLKLIDFENGSILEEIDGKNAFQKARKLNLTKEQKESFDAKFSGSVYFKPPWITSDVELTPQMLKSWDIYSLG